MEESVPNRPYRSHEGMDEESVKRAKGPENGHSRQAVEDIRGRDPNGNIQRLKDLLEKCRDRSHWEGSGNIEIEARFGVMQGSTFDAGMTKHDFQRVVQLLESTDRIQASPPLEEVNYIYDQNGQAYRIIQSTDGQLRSDSKKKFANAHFDSLSTQALYTLRVAGAREMDRPTPTEIATGWHRRRQKTRREFRLDNSSWKIHATEVIATTNTSKLESASFEMELELPLVAGGLTTADTERQLNELNEGISFLLHVLVCGRRELSTLSWVPPTPISSPSQNQPSSSLAEHASVAEYRPGDRYVPHPNLHPDSHYQRSPNGTYRGQGSEHNQSGGYSSYNPSMQGSGEHSYADASYSNQYGSYDSQDHSLQASSSSGLNQEVAHHYTATGANSDFSTIRLEPVRDSHQIRSIRDLLDSCRPHKSNKGGSDFWGTMPISFSRRYLESVLKEDYHISEKTDGLRYLMVISHDCGGMFLVNRSGHIFSVSDFNQVPGFSHVFNNTVLDGEMVIHQRTNLPYFLLFDCVRFKGDSVVHLPLDGRLKTIGDFVATYRHQFPDTRAHPFGLLGKTVLPKSRLAQITKSIVEDASGKRTYIEGDGTKRCHLTDGLIFTPSKLPYAFGTCFTMFKWKYVDLQSIDFLIKFDSPPDPNQNLSRVPARCRKVELHINMNQGKPSRCKNTELIQADFERLMFDLKTADLTPRSDRIIAEMAFEPKDSSWRYHRLRTDKKTPNHISVAFDTMEAIAENLTLDDIVATLAPKQPPK